MKVILLKDVAKLGRRLSVVEVADGRGQNQLIPQGLALPATPENLKKVKEQNAQKSAAFEAGATVFMAAMATLSESPLVIKVEANDQGHMFQAVKAEQVVAAAAILGAALQPSEVHFSSPIKSLGEHEVELKHDKQVKKISIIIEKL